MACANAGISVLLKETEQAALDRGMATIRKNYESSVKKGRFSQAVMDQRMALIHPQLTYDGFDQADLIIEAVFESMPLKKQIFGEIDKIAKPDCVLASNTSTLDIDEIAAATSRPQMVIGLHFFSPAHVMRLVEIVRGKHAEQRSGRDVAGDRQEAGQGRRGGGKLPRLRRQSHDAAVHARGAVSGGGRFDAASRWTRAHRFRHGHGDLRRGRYGRDRSGVSREAGVRHLRKPGERVPLVLDKLFEMGRLGQKRGMGWYRYDESRAPIPDPEVDALIEKTAHEAGIARRTIIRRRNHRALRLHDDQRRRSHPRRRTRAARGRYRRDLLAPVTDFPAYRGGPMWYADTVGLDKILNRIVAFQEQHGPRWEPAPLLRKLAGEGSTFANFDRSRAN